MSRILVVDDVIPMAEQYAYDLKRLRGHEVTVAGSGQAALDALDRGGADCVILDLEMPGMDGFEVLRRIRHAGNDVPVIVYTGTGDFDRCAQAIRLGADGFIDKGEPMERVAQEVDGAIERHRLRREVYLLQRRLGESALLGNGAAMTRLRETISRVAPVPGTVLILGESGTGKELVARELHRLGSRPAGPFVAINCAALPEQLVESELFGHERGAFTGAVAQRKGAFESASGGTLFLDEIGDLPLPAQAKLLRVLEQREVQRVGATRPVPVDVRVLAATNRDLDEAVKAGRFREDLFYRINVHVLRVPPLRDRREDVPGLADRFLEEICRRYGVLPRKLSGEARERLVAYDWRRNNVRELRNAMERLVVTAEGETIRAEHLPPEIRGDGASAEAGAEPQTFQELKHQAERTIVLAALERHQWHVSRTAEALGLADHASLL
ncbi:MAG TPA: sigma-54 dependent transcriptional regulator, partial [Gemmatimonadales bacterium]|nr:sigma-54 dependent transcriptional regulator [Gemmatimonadales bacterium]